MSKCKCAKQSKTKTTTNHFLCMLYDDMNSIKKLSVMSAVLPHFKQTTFTSSSKKMHQAKSCQKKYTKQHIHKETDLHDCNKYYWI